MLLKYLFGLKYVSNNVPIFIFREFNASHKILFYRSKICTTLQRQTHMGNSPHDSHQFYFERYLRNKLSGSEKSQLEERLVNDKELNQAFEHYKSNRKSLLKELITEHDSGPKRSRLANIFYLTITIVGIAVATNYYLENRSLKEEINRDKKLIKRLVSYIPFVGKKIIKDSNEYVSTRTKNKPINDNKTLNIITDQNDSSLFDKETLDELLFDTILIPIKRSYYEEKLAFYLNEFSLVFGTKMEEEIQTQAIGQDQVLVYSVPDALSTLLTRSFPTGKWINYISSLVLSNQADGVCLSLFEDYFIVLILQNGKPHFVNYFNRSGDDQNKYLLLNACVQSNTLPKDSNLNVTGYSAERDIWIQDLASYFANAHIQHAPDAGIGATLNAEYPNHSYAPYFIF